MPSPVVVRTLTMSAMGSLGILLNIIIYFLFIIDLGRSSRHNVLFQWTLSFLLLARYLPSPSPSPHLQTLAFFSTSQKLGIMKSFMMTWECKLIVYESCFSCQWSSFHLFDIGCSMALNNRSFVRMISLFWQKRRFAHTGCPKKYMTETKSFDSLRLLSGDWINFCGFL